MTAADPDPLAAVRHPVTLAVLGLCGVLVTGAIGFTVTRWTLWTGWETDALAGIALTHAPSGVALASFIAWLFAPTSAVVITFASAIVIGIWSRSLTRGLVFAVIAVVCWGASEAMKFLVHRPRPQLMDAIVPTPTSFSFPSGHVAFTCAIVLALLFTLRTWRHRWVVWILGAILVLIVAWSRMYLGVHFPSDVTAAVLLMLSMAAIVIPLIVNVALPLLRGTREPRVEGAVHGGDG